jgi:hypothetical protein
MRTSSQPASSHQQPLTSQRQPSQAASWPASQPKPIQICFRLLQKSDLLFTLKKNTGKQQSDKIKIGVGWLGWAALGSKAACWQTASQPTPRRYSDFCKSLDLQARISEPASISQKVNGPAKPAHPAKPPKPEELTQNEFSQPVMAQNRFHCFSQWLSAKACHQQVGRFHKLLPRHKRVLGASGVGFEICVCIFQAMGTSGIYFKTKSMIVSIMGVSGVDFENDCSAFPGYRYQRLRRRNPFVYIFRYMGASGVDVEMVVSAFSALWAQAASISKFIVQHFLDYGL